MALKPFLLFVLNERVMSDLNVLMVIHVMDDHLYATRPLPPLFLHRSNFDECRNMNGLGNLVFSSFPEILFPSP